MEIMAAHDIDIPASKMAETPAEAEKACAEIMGGDCEFSRAAIIGTSCGVFCARGMSGGSGDLCARACSVVQRHSGVLCTVDPRLLRTHKFRYPTQSRFPPFAFARVCRCRPPATAMKDVVIKAQVLSGGRGRGHFDNGFQSGVHMCLK